MGEDLDSLLHGHLDLRVTEAGAPGPLPGPRALEWNPRGAKLWEGPASAASGQTPRQLSAAETAKVKLKWQVGDGKAARHTHSEMCW